MPNTFPFPPNPTNGQTYQLGDTVFTYYSATDEWVGNVNGQLIGATGPTGATGPEGATGAAGTANTAFGAIGTYCIAMSTETFTGSTVASIVPAGTTVSGSSLVRGSMSDDQVAPFSGNGQTLFSTLANTTTNGLTGSWRQMCATKNSSVYIAMTLWVRYA